MHTCLSHVINLSLSALSFQKFNLYIRILHLPSVSFTGPFTVFFPHRNISILMSAWRQMTSTWPQYVCSICTLLPLTLYELGILTITFNCTPEISVCHSPCCKPFIDFAATLSSTISWVYLFIFFIFEPNLIIFLVNGHQEFRPHTNDVWGAWYLYYLILFFLYVFAS